MASTLIRLTRRTPHLRFAVPARPKHSVLRSSLRRLSKMASAATPVCSFLNQRDAAALDADLMGELRFSVEQLMELAGLSVASAVHTEYSVETYPRVLVVAGPGNNGGDGLVAARHLKHFGHTVQIAYPLPTNRLLYDNLLNQCLNVDVELARPAVIHVKSLSVGRVRKSGCKENGLREKFDLVVDAIFGFSFHGKPRPPFDEILEALSPDRSPPKIVSIDIPSGWDVEKGDVEGKGIQPDMLVSLSAPKLCAQYFKGRYHYLGGRFLPPSLVEKFNLRLPSYRGSQQCVKLNDVTSQLSAMRENYADGALEEADLASDPFELFKLWLEEYRTLGATRELNAMVLATCGESGLPSARVVLLKGLEHGGFVFYTNYESKKSTQIRDNANVALCFYMAAMHRQIRIEGRVQRLAEAESDAYFASRPRKSQIGAWASAQSSILPNRAALESRLQEMERRFGDTSEPIPRPENWGGFVVVPLSIEFWVGREGRLHDRCEYFRPTVDAAWSLRRLSP